MPTFNDTNEENQNNQLQPRFKPFSADEEMMSPSDQQLGNEVGMLLQAQRDKKLEDDYFQTVRDNANVDEETRFARADKYFAERYGIETRRGAAINSGNDYKMKPFESSAAYENALVTMAEKGYEGIASERYRNLLASERLGDEAATKAEIIKQAQIETEEDVDDLSKPYVTSPGVVTYQKIRQPRKQEDIDRDVAEYRANVLGENFVALFEHFRPDLSEEGERIVRAVVKNGSLPADEHMAFNNLYSADPKQGDLVKFLAEQAKETEYDLNGAAGRGMAGMLKQIIEGAGEKIGQGLYRFSSGLDAMDYAWTGSGADRLNRMNRTERDEYERLRAEGLGEQQAIDNVAGQMQKRFLDEMLCLEDRTRSRRAELALKDLMAKREWEHYGYWENAYIGAATTVPYMAVTAVPYAGFAVNVFSHMQDVEDQIIREGGDPTKAQAARAIGAVAWTAIEKMELKGFGRSLTKLEKTVMWRHLWQGQAKMALGELGTAAKIGGKDILLNWAKETGQEGLQGTIESIETDLGLDKDAAAIFKNAIERTWDETKNSAGTMAIISTAYPIGGAVIRAPIQRRKMQDRESVVAYITRQEQLKNMLQGAQLSDQGTPEMQTKRVTKAYNEIQNVWDAAATPQVAMEKYQEIGYTEDKAVKIAEYFDMRAEILRNAARLPETQGLRDAMIAGNAFRVGHDTTFNPADLFHLINANIVTEEVEVPTPGAANAAPQKALRVSVPMKDANGAETTKDFTVVVNNETPDIETPSFASSVAQATQGTEVQKTAEEYLAMSRDEKEAFLLANDLKKGGDFQVLDQDGKTIFSSDALVQLARANSAFVRKGGNWTLAHETAHGIVAFARQMGVFDPDADTTKVMVKLFGGPTNDKEAWNEEAMADAFAEYLRGKYDFKGLSRDERGIVERVFDAVIDFFKNAYYRLTGKTPDPAAVELKAREEALDAVFEGIRSGDFSGLSAFAGIDFGEDREKDAAQKPQEGPSTASAAETKNEPSATEEAAPEAPGTVSAPSAATTAAEERVKQAHAAQNGVKVTQATPTQASLQAQLARIEAKLAELTADPKGAAANVPTPRKTPKGEETRATPQGGVKFKIAWQWIPRAELVTSDKAEYPQEFQPRDRASRVASDLQVIENTRPGRFDPMKLAYSYDSDGGAPIVAGGNVVLSGNGRSMKLGQLAKEGRYADNLAKISDWADEYGIGRPPAGMKEPVLVQRITSTEKREDLLKIAELSNRAKILTRSEAENAEADAKLITPTMMRLFRPSEDGDLQAASNADFMQAFIASAPDAKGLTNADGTPTDQAVRRVQNALLSAVLGQDRTTRALLKTLLEKRGDLGLGDLYRALIKSSGALLSNRSAKASFDLLPHIRRAVGQYVSWRSARLSNPRYTLDEHLRTRDMFAGAPSKEAEAVARLLEAGRFGRVLDKYNELVALKAPDAQASFFAEDTAYQTLAKAERAVLLEGETPVTLDPNDALAAEPLQAPPAEVTPAPVAVEPEPTTDEPAPAPAPVQEEATTFEPQPVRRGTATVPAQNAEKIVAYNVNAEGQPTTDKKILPVGAYNLLRGPYDVRKPPKASVQDKAGRGLGIGFTAPTHDAKGRYWGKIFPLFQGNKTEMADRTSQAIRKLMPKAERESYKTVVDYFGGGGCWGLYHALTNFPNADRLAINEWEQGRIAKIRLLHEKGAAVADEASKLIIEDLYAELKKACMVGEGNTESGSGTTIASKLEPMAERYRNDENKLGLIYAVVDCARTMLANRTDAAGNPSFDAGFDAIIDNLREDGKKAKEAADAFKARGGTIAYRQGDAANYAEAPAGTDVVAVCDPPYYLTAGYNGQVSVPIDANGMGWDYKTTRRLLDGLVDKGDAIVYTDEAWWFKETYTPDQQEDLFGGGSTFAQEQEILLGIINALDHFDVAGRVVGRQEVLGINHGHKTTDGRAEGVAGTPRGAGETAEGAADGRGVQGNHPGDALEGLAAGAEGQDADLLGDGAGRGREGDAESVALAREIAAVQIEEAAADADVQVTPKIANIIRSSVRQVREKHILDYAKTVSTNAKAWIKRQEKALDRQMAAKGYTEKVWHGTGVEDFDVFRLATREEHGSKPGAIGADKDIKMAFFSYQETTAENYAALSSYDIDTDYETLEHGATPNVRQYYVNKGKCLEIDEANWPMDYQAWTETLRNAHADGYNSVRVKNAVDDQGARLPRKEGDPMEWLDYEGTNEAGSEYDGEAGGFKSDILVVFDQPNDPGANRIKASDPVTFWDEKHGELPIPLEMRANRDFPDLRFSVTMGKRAKEEARSAIEKYRPDYGLWVGLTTSKIDAYEKTYQNETRKASTDDYGNMDDEFLDWMQGKEVDLAVDDIAAFPTPKERKAALLWFCKDTVRLPEDAPKITDALKTAERAKVDPMQFERPGDILEQFAEYRPKGKPINPDKVPELTDRKDMGHGIVTYLVQDDKAGQAAMRQIINTHFGKDANPWCLLQGDGNGNPTDDAWDYWNNYNALPKRVAFKDGRLCAFMATDGGRSEITAGDIARDAKPSDAEEWWDRNDAPHPGIPFKTKDEGGRTVEQELMQDGAIETISITKGDPKAENGIFEVWNLTHDDTSSYYHVVTERRDGNPFSEQRFYKNGTLGVEINFQNDGRDYIKKTYRSNGQFNYFEAQRGQDYTHVYTQGDGVSKGFLRIDVHEHGRSHEEVYFEEATAGRRELVAITREYTDEEGRQRIMRYQYTDGALTELSYEHENVTINELNRLYLPQIKADDIFGLVEAAWNDGGAVITRISDMATKTPRFSVAKASEPTQIKSATDDTGAFDGTNPDVRYSVRTAWTPDFPKATCMTTRASLMAKHGELFNKAKAGGIRAATELVKDVVKPDKVSAIAAEHPNAIVVPAHAEEARGRNKLPIAYAKYICTTTGLDYEDGIVQSVRAHHTGADAEHRLFVNPVFVGAVRRGREYIIVDDHITQGGTVNALRDHIESRGGKVVAVTSLTLSQGSSILSPRKETIDEIKQKWPDIDDLLRAAGIAERADALTESQLKYIAKFSADTFRDRVASAGREGSFGVLRQGVRAPQGYAGTEEDRQVAPVRRASVRRGNNPMKAEDVAAGFLAARFLAGKETSVEDADRMLKNVGLRVDAPAMLERAKALADRNRDRLRASVEAKSPEVVAALANANLQDRAADSFNTAITTGAAAADPDIGVSMQRTADRFAARELQTSKGFTSAQMQAELPISLADAVFAVAEYEKTPEEKARLEEWKKKRDEENTAAEEARKADPDAETPIEEAERLARDLSYREPSAEERAYFDQLMDRARFADEARAQEELRQKLAEQKKKDAQEANADNADNDDNDAEGADDEKAEADAILPFDTVKRIAPVFESSELFAQFVVEWTTDHILKKHPELQNREDLWKSPVAVKELVKTAQHLLRDLAKQTLGSPSINAARNYVDQAIINMADYKTFRAIRKNVAHIYDRIHDNALRISRRKLVRELIYGKRDNAEDGPGFKGLRALAGIKGRFSATTEAGDRAIDAKTELWCRWLIPYLTMTEEALQKEEDRLRAIISRHDTEDEAYGYDKEDNTKYAESKDRLAMLNVYGGMVRWLPGKIIDAREQILEQVNGKRQAFEQARAEREAEDKTIRDAIIAAVEAGASDDYLHRSEVGDRLDRILYSMNGNLTLEMQNLIRFCKDPAKREAALLAIEDLSVIMSRGTERYRVTLATARKEVNDGLAAYYGNAEVGIRHLMHEQVPEDVAKRIFTQSRQKVQTYGQLLQLYATTIQADYKENAEKHGRTANLELMEKTLTPQDIAFHAWAVNWYAANREALSDAVEEITGLGVTSPDRLYCPARMDRDPDGFTVDAVAWSPVPSALNRRVAHGLDFNEAANFLTCVMEQAEVRAQTIGYGMTGIRLRDIIAHHELQKAVSKHVGRADMRLVTDHVKDVLVQGAAKKDAIEWLAPLNFARKWMARFYLSGNIPSALKQLASMPVWANAMLGGQEIGLQKCLGYLTSVGTEDGRQAIEDLINSDGFKARYQMGWSEEIQNLLTHPSKNRLVRYFEKAYDSGMMVNKAVDAVSCLWMAQGFYRDAKALFERRGFTPEQAKDNALAITWSVCENGQQSGRIENMNKAQRHGGALVSAVFQFKTAFLLQNNYIIQAISDTRAGTPGAKGRLARGLFINTVYIPAFVAVVNAIWSAVMGDQEPPEDPEKAPQWLKDFAWSMIEGVTAPLFMTGSIIHAGFDAIFGKTGYDDNASIPAVEGIMRVGKHAGKAIADTIALITPMDVAEEVTPEKVKEDLLRLAADIAAPVRHVRKAIKNRTED
jgi:hypothetical protein